MVRIIFYALIMFTAYTNVDSARNSSISIVQKEFGKVMHQYGPSNGNQFISPALLQAQVEASLTKEKLKIKQSLLNYFTYDNRENLTIVMWASVLTALFMMTTLPSSYRRKSVLSY